MAAPAAHGRIHAGPAPAHPRAEKPGHIRPVDHAVVPRSPPDTVPRVRDAETPCSPHSGAGPPLIGAVSGQTRVWNRGRRTRRWLSVASPRRSTPWRRQTTVSSPPTASSPWNGMCSRGSSSRPSERLLTRKRRPRPHRAAPRTFARVIPRPFHQPHSCDLRQIACDLAGISTLSRTDTVPMACSGSGFEDTRSPSRGRTIRAGRGCASARGCATRRGRCSWVRAPPREKRRDAPRTPARDHPSRAPSRPRGRIEASRERFFTVARDPLSRGARPLATLGSRAGADPRRRASSEHSTRAESPVLSGVLPCPGVPTGAPPAGVRARSNHALRRARRRSRR